MFRIAPISIVLALIILLFSRGFLKRRTAEMIALEEAQLQRNPGP
jgi:hypothetical protein